MHFFQGDILIDLFGCCFFWFLSKKISYANGNKMQKIRQPQRMREGKKSTSAVNVAHACDSSNLSTN